MKKRYLMLSILIIGATLAATAWLYPGLPARIPVHWNSAGDIDGYGAKAMLFMMPAEMAMVLALLVALPRADPRAFSIKASGDAYWFSAMVATGLQAYIQAMLLWGASGNAVDLRRALVGGIAVFMVMLGNVMGKVRRNFWLGVRTPWTLANERVWYATHRLAAKTMVGGSVLALFAVLSGAHPSVGVWLIMGGLLVPAAWSLLYYKRLERDGKLDA